MGVVGLLTATTGLVAGLTNFGLGTSAVKNISEANATDNHERILCNSSCKTFSLDNGILGSLVTLVASPHG